MVDVGSAEAHLLRQHAKAADQTEQERADKPAEVNQPVTAINRHRMASGRDGPENSDASDIDTPDRERSSICSLAQENPGAIELQYR